MSYRLAPAAIIPIPKQANPNVSGQTLDCRAQLIACSTVVVMTFSSNRPSIHGWKLSSLTCPPNRTNSNESKTLFYDAVGVKVQHVAPSNRHSESLTFSPKISDNIIFSIVHTLRSRMANSG